MPKTKRSPEHTEHDHAAKMAACGTWPTWPWLPLKRHVNKSSPELALLHADHTDAPVRVYHANLHTVGWLPSPDLKFTDYPTIDAVVTDGWLVD